MFLKLILLQASRLRRYVGTIILMKWLRLRKTTTDPSVHQHLKAIGFCSFFLSEQKMINKIEKRRRSITSSKPSLSSWTSKRTDEIPFYVQMLFLLFIFLESVFFSHLVFDGFCSIYTTVMCASMEWRASSRNHTLAIYLLRTNKQFYGGICIYALWLDKCEEEPKYITDDDVDVDDNDQRLNLCVCVCLMSHSQFAICTMLQCTRSVNDADRARLQRKVNDIFRVATKFHLKSHRQ